MDEHPHTDTLPVYQEDEEFASEEAPRRFALCVFDEGEENDPLDLDDVIAWGLEFGDTTLVTLRHPVTGRRDYGLFNSAERARAFYSRFGALRLVYA